MMPIDSDFPVFHSNEDIQILSDKGDEKEENEEKEIFIVKEILPDLNPLRKEINYGIEDIPHWPTCLLLGFQHYVMMVGSTISIPFILAPFFCLAEDDPAKGKLISTIIFASGIVTLLQTTVGVRLPIIQGGSYAFLLPTIVILTTSFPSCDNYNLSNMTTPERDELWMERMREIQGAIIVSALVQVVIGLTGAIGILISIISPLTIVPTITLIGLSLFKTAMKISAEHWGISLLTAILFIVFSQYLKNVAVPFPFFSGRRCRWTKCYVFMQFPVILSILISWTICGILTATDALRDDSEARTDTKLALVRDSPWFYVPYPFQWGLPTVSVSSVVGMLAGVISSMIESIGDYYACARLSEIEAPPKHAFNRGIGTEGVGCLIAGILGSGNGTTSYSDNIGAIRVTKVASRRVIQVAAIMMIFCGILGKFGAAFITLPSPVIGGLSLVTFAFVTSVGLSNLQSVNLNSSRNLFVLGFSLFIGLAVPEWLSENSDVIQTGSLVLDQLLKVLLRTHMFVGGFLGLVLDNTIPGTDEERGLTDTRIKKCEVNATADASFEGSPYDLPFGMNLIRRMAWCTKIPVSPTYKEEKQSSKFSCISKLRKLIFRKSSLPTTA